MIGWMNFGDWSLQSMTRRMEGVLQQSTEPWTTRVCGSKRDCCSVSNLSQATESWNTHNSGYEHSDIRKNPELQKWFCAKCGAASRLEDISSVEVARLNQKNGNESSFKRINVCGFRSPAMPSSSNVLTYCSSSFNRAWFNGARRQLVL